MREGLGLLQLRVKYLIKENFMEKAALLAKACSDFHPFGGGRGHFKQSYLVCVCSFAPQEMLMVEVGGTAEALVNVSFFSMLYKNIRMTLSRHCGFIFYFFLGSSAALPGGLS